MDDSVVQFIINHSPPQETGTEWWLIIGQFLVVLTALGVPFLMHALENRRHRNRVREKAERVWLSLQKEARLLAKILEESDGHWRDPSRHARHTVSMHRLDIPPIIGTPSNWAGVLEINQASLVSDLWNSLCYYNKWIEFLAAVNSQESTKRNTEKLIESLDSLWKALQLVDPKISETADGHQSAISHSV